MESAKRSKAYYRTVAGKKKKQIQNGKRSDIGTKTAPACPGVNGPANELIVEVDGTEEGVTGFDKVIVDYVRMTTSLIEGRNVGLEEIIEMLKKTMRQHSIVHEKRIDYILRVLEKRPP